MNYFVLSLILSLGHAFPCTWTAPDGHAYDFSSLTVEKGKPEYRTQDMTSIFISNVCEKATTNQKCADNDGMLCEFDLKSGEYVTTLAKAEDPTWDYIEKSDPGIGVKMSFRNGDLCQRYRPAEHTTWIAPRDAVYLFRCSTDAGLSSIINEFTECLTVVTIHTPLACSGEAPKPEHEGAQPAIPFEPPVTPPSQGEPQGEPLKEQAGEELEEEEHRHRMLFILLVLIAVYVIGGCVYNSQKFHLSGMDACPHSDFWMRVPSLCLDFGNFVVEKCRCCRRPEYEPLPQSAI